MDDVGSGCAERPRPFPHLDAALSTDQVCPHAHTHARKPRVPQDFRSTKSELLSHLACVE